VFPEKNRIIGISKISWSAPVQISYYIWIPNLKFEKKGFIKENDSEENNFPTI